MSETQTSPQNNSKRTIIIVVIILALLACCAFLCLGVAGYLGVTIYTSSSNRQGPVEILPSPVNLPDEKSEQPTPTPTPNKPGNPAQGIYEKLLGDWRSSTIYKSLELGYESSMQAYMARLIIKGGMFGEEEVVGPWKVVTDPAKLEYQYEILNDENLGMYYLEIIGTDQTYVFVVRNVEGNKMQLEEACIQRPCNVQPFTMTKS